MNKENPSDSAYEQYLKGFLDITKLHQDSLKHITTLSSGSVVVLATLLDKLQGSLILRILLIIVLACFATSILTCVMAMGQYMRFIMRVHTRGFKQDVIKPRIDVHDEFKDDVKSINHFVSLGLGVFVIAFILLAVFTLMNVLVS